MRNVIWQPKALADFDAQIAFIAEKSPQGASLVADRIEAAVNLLAANAIGRPGRVPGTYEFFVPRTSHFIAYAFVPNSDALSILRIVHSARDWQEGQWPKD